MRSTLNGNKRYRRLLSFFGSIVFAFTWLRVQRLWHSRRWIKERSLNLSLAYARRFRVMAVEMGGLMIKLGQFFSTRVDLLPGAVVKELATLQDEVQELPFSALEPVFLAEFNRPAQEIFAWIDSQAIAAASLGQVHEGRLSDGSRVAIKILRPGIEEMTEIDLRVIRIVIRYLKRSTRWGEIFDLDLIYQEFSETVNAELDYRQEGKNAETMAENLKAWNDVLFPKIYWDHSSHRVLTMQYMEGVKINELDAITALGADRQKIAKLILDIYCQQMLIDGFFHADPHPGNLLVSPDGKLVMLDFGMVGYIAPALKQQIIDFCVLILKQDYFQAAEQLITMGFLRPHADSQLIGRLIQTLVDVFMASRQRPDNQAMQQLLLDLEELLYHQPFQIPGNYVFIGRAGGILLGICAGLDPKINFIETVRPYFDRFIRQERLHILRTIKTEGGEWAANLLALPDHIHRSLHRLEHGEITVNVSQRALITALEQQNRSLQLLARIMLWGIFVAASCYCWSHAWWQCAGVGAVLSGLLLVWVLLGFRSVKTSRHGRKT